MLLNLPDILMLLLIVQLFFVSIYLFSKTTGKAVSNRLLACFFGCISLSLADNFLLRTGVWYRYPEAATLSSGFPLLYGPLLLFYTQSLIYKNFRVTPKKLLHFLPFSLMFVVSFIGYEVQPFSFKISLLHAINGHHVPAGLYAPALLMIFHFTGYGLSALSQIKKYNALALNKYSVIQQTNLKWLSSTIIFFLVLFALSLTNNIMELGLIPAYKSAGLITILLLLFYFINRLMFKALNNPEIFSWVDENDMPVKFGTGVAPTLPDKTNELNMLSAYMQTNKPYLNPELTVEVMARAMRMQPKDLSKLINEQLRQNFFDFINRYRINDAKDLLINHPDKKITVLEILYKTGFNSKSSFNTLFKKYTGLTPTDFKNQNS
jgi:AraC-like DNA-binding protein